MPFASGLMSGKSLGSPLKSLRFRLCCERPSKSLLPERSSFFIAGLKSVFPCAHASRCSFPGRWSVWFINTATLSRLMLLVMVEHGRYLELLRFSPARRDGPPIISSDRRPVDCLLSLPTKKALLRCQPAPFLPQLLQRTTQQTRHTSTCNVNGELAGRARLARPRVRAWCSPSPRSRDRASGRRCRSRLVKSRWLKAGSAQRPHVPLLPTTVHLVVAWKTPRPVHQGQEPKGARRPARRRTDPEDAPRYHAPPRTQLSRLRPRHLWQTQRQPRYFHPNLRARRPLPLARQPKALVHYASGAATPSQPRRSFVQSPRLASHGRYQRPSAAQR